MAQYIAGLIRAMYVGPMSTVWPPVRRELCSHTFRLEAGNRAIDNERGLKMATSPTESPPPPLFRSQSVQVRQQWLLPTIASWCSSWVCMPPKYGSRGKFAFILNGFEDLFLVQPSCKHNVNANLSKLHCVEPSNCGGS